MSYIVQTPSKTYNVPANWSITIGRATYFFRWLQWTATIEDVEKVYVN